MYIIQIIYNICIYICVVVLYYDNLAEVDLKAAGVSQGYLLCLPGS